MSDPVKVQYSDLYQKDSERRRDLRSDIQMEVDCTHDQVKFRGVSKNISKGGMLLVARDILPLQSQVSMAFTLPHTTVNIDLNGLVVWYKETNGNSDISKEGIMGIQFQWQDLAKNIESHP